MEDDQNGRQPQQKTSSENGNMGKSNFANARKNCLNKASWTKSQSKKWPATLTTATAGCARKPPGPTKFKTKFSEFGF